MSAADLINTAGVSLILLAFLLLQLKKVSATSTLYLVMNLLGGGLATCGSFMIKAWPFVVLEGVWALVALISLVNSLARSKRN